MRGAFITFEGVEGAGKSTQASLLVEHLRARGLVCVLTREPGGTEIGERVRAILKDPALNQSMSLRTEALLMQAARAQHVDELVAPALARGEIVVCDRFADSSTAYQGVGRKLGAAVDWLNDFSTGGLVPDLTIILDLPIEEGLDRAGGRSRREDRFETEGTAFHVAVREAFLQIAAAAPARVNVIPASGGVDHIHESVRKVVDVFLSRR